MDWIWQKTISELEMEELTISNLKCTEKKERHTWNTIGIIEREEQVR